MRNGWMFVDLSRKNFRTDFDETLQRYSLGIRITQATFNPEKRIKSVPKASSFINETNDLLRPKQIRSHFEVSLEIM